MFSAQHMQNSVLISDLRAAHPSGLRRKSAAFVLASTLRNSRRNSRVSISSIEVSFVVLVTYCIATLNWSTLILNLSIVESPGQIPNFICVALLYIPREFSEIMV